MIRMLAVCLLLSASIMTMGCFGQSKGTGKYGNQDKPKPAGSTEK
jgi:hypothetical protein